jgi:hypothetical protein
LVAWVAGIVIYGPERASVEVRTDLIDLLKVILGGVLVTIGNKTKTE